MTISLNSKVAKSKPFLKWVGGKTQIIDEIRKNLPQSYSRYLEPFLGGGAVFFRLIPKNKEAFLSDINQNLISAYLDIRDNIYEVMSNLDRINGNFVNLTSQKKRKRYFLSIREEYNKSLGSRSDSPLRTARLIFLNKTCFNGVYRENNAGQFNVPFGKPNNSNSSARANILAVYQDLRGKHLLNKDFGYVVNKAKKGDFVYLDPPYLPLKKNQSSTKYHTSSFGEKEHKELAEVFEKLDKKGCFVLMSNSSTTFIKDLYKKYKKYFVIVDANRNINCKGELRRPVKEILIKNY